MMLSGRWATCGVGKGSGPFPPPIVIGPVGLQGGRTPGPIEFGPGPGGLGYEGRWDIVLTGDVPPGVKDEAEMSIARTPSSREAMLMTGG